MITHVLAPMTSLCCGAPVQWLTNGTSNGREASCMVACTQCGGEHLLTARLSLDPRTCRSPARLASLARARAARKGAAGD